MNNNNVISIQNYWLIHISITLIKKDWPDWQETSKQTNFGDNLTNGWGLSITECAKHNTGWGKIKNLNLTSVNKEKPSPYEQ